MRDGLILVLLVVVTFWAFFKPWIGIMAWTLVSLMSPHAEFGYSAAGWPVATGIAGATLLGLLHTKERQNPFYGLAPKLLLALCVWITVTLPFSIYVDFSLPLWERSMKIFLMLFVTLALVDTRHKLDWFIAMFVIGIGYYGVKGGLFTALTGGNYRVWGPGGFVQGNNELGLAVIMVIPWMRYLQLRMANKWARLAMTGAMAACALMVLGTHSRGAFLGVAAMVALFWWKSKGKLLWGLLLVAGGIVALASMPEHWWERMGTIKTYDADESALGRLNAWKLAITVAQERFTGGGFYMWDSAVFLRYSDDPERHFAAHSIYFQILGEQGWVGLALFLGIGIATWMAARSLIIAARKDPAHQWAADLGAMAQVSLVGYAVAGAFLSLTWFDLPYNVMAAVVLAHRLVFRPQPSPAASWATPPATARPQPGGPNGAHGNHPIGRSR
jgi:putative inorganic carbon (hco3(-)) transporter